eukprot:6707624-Heterocapsa_arctica.AAC.1
MSGCTCPGGGAHPNHCPCAGKYTRMTEEYTWPMTDLVHSAWRESTYAVNEGIETEEAAAFRTLNQGIFPAMPCVKLGSLPVSQHREKIREPEPIYNAM